MSVVQQTPMVPAWLLVLVGLIAMVVVAVLFFEYTLRLNKQYYAEIEEINARYRDATTRSLEALVETEKLYKDGIKERDDKFIAAVKDIEKQFGDKLQAAFMEIYNG